jgi:nucleotidyltransferase-like protein
MASPRRHACCPGLRADGKISPMPLRPPPGVTEFGDALRPLAWVTALWVGGSAASGDHRLGVSDLDLVALVDGPVDDERQAILRTLHTALEAGAAHGLDLGCVYVDATRVLDVEVPHPTWTHGNLVQRILSGISRAELVRHGWTVFGPAPTAVLPTMSDDDVRRAAHAELTGYWTRAARRPWWWFDPALAELGPSAMARGRHTLRSGQLLSKSDAVEVADVPPWLIAMLRARRRGELVALPRLRTAMVTWRDARRTTAAARRWRPRQS